MYIRRSVATLRDTARQTKRFCESGQPLIDCIAEVTSEALKAVANRKEQDDTTDQDSNNRTTKHIPRTSKELADHT